MVGRRWKYGLMMANLADALEEVIAIAAGVIWAGLVA